MRRIFLCEYKYENISEPFDLKRNIPRQQDVLTYRKRAHKRIWVGRHAYNFSINDKKNEKYTLVSKVPSLLLNVIDTSASFVFIIES